MTILFCLFLFQNRVPKSVCTGDRAVHWNKCLPRTRNSPYFSIIIWLQVWLLCSVYNVTGKCADYTENIIAKILVWELPTSCCTVVMISVGCWQNPRMILWRMTSPTQRRLTWSWLTVIVTASKMRARTGRYGRVAPHEHFVYKIPGVDKMRIHSVLLTFQMGSEIVWWSMARFIYRGSFCYATCFQRIWITPQSCL